jgi:hypothetical protein
MSGQDDEDPRLKALSRVVSAARRGGLPLSEALAFSRDYLHLLSRVEFRPIEGAQRGAQARAARGTEPPYSRRRFEAARKKAGGKRGLTAEYLKHDPKTVRKYWHYWDEPTKT